MNNYIKLNNQQKILLIEQSAIESGLSKQVIEKDLWVTTMLQIIFSLPIADRLIFKGGTSLSKVWGLITRFSEDIDLAIDREVFGEQFKGDLTKKGLKRLRKESSVYVRDNFTTAINQAIESYGLSDYLQAKAQEDGEGDGTYPEPRKVFVYYKTLFDKDLAGYLNSEIVLEVSSRSLVEPFEKCNIKSIVSETLPFDTTLVDCAIPTALPAKTFLEKAFLLHELFTTGGGASAQRKSRHLYDLEKMMDKDFAKAVISNDELWGTISHHREVFTPLKDVDYTPDIRDRIVLIPPTDIIEAWQKDYDEMAQIMIYGEKLSFDALIDRIGKLEENFKSR